MREIKFRAWDRVNKRIYKVSKLDLPYYNETLMQYIGLEDKNGKEIYEGDIVTCEGFERLELDVKGKYDLVVSFDWHGACIKHNTRHIRLDMLHNWEVIGNIYENKELLNDKD